MPEKIDELALKILSGDPSAFDEVHNRYQKSVYTFAFLRLGDAESAKDIRQEVFLRLYQKRDDLRASGSLHSLLIKIAENCIYEHRRKNPTNRSIDEPGNNNLICNDLEEKQIEKQKKELVANSLNQLDTDIALTLIEHVKHEMSFEEIAKKLGVSVGTVKSRVFRGREQLKKWLNGLY